MNNIGLYQATHLKTFSLKNIVLTSKWVSDNKLKKVLSYRALLKTIDRLGLKSSTSAINGVLSTSSSILPCSKKQKYLYLYYKDMNVHLKISSYSYLLY